MAAPTVHERLAVHIGLAREVRAREAAVQRALQHRLALDEGDGRVLFERHPGGRLYLIRLRHQRALTWLGPAQPHAKSRRMRSRSGHSGFSHVSTDATLMPCSILVLAEH